MPELPEVETIVRNLRGNLIGKTIAEVVVRKPQMVDDPSAFTARLTGRGIDGVQRRGKYILLGLGDLTLLVHLGMTGRLLYDSQVVPKEKHTHLVFCFEAGGQLAYHDPRRFGRLRLIDTDGDKAIPPLLRLGPDPLESSFTIEELARMTSRSGRSIKDFLLDQTKIAGIGNIYACEIIHHATLHPCARVKELSPRQVDTLYHAIREVLLRGIEYRGTTISDYRDADGEKGGFQELLQVYGRGGEYCRRCKGKILRIVQSQRSTFFCPVCQRAHP
jgi:formamidopyrimidine-DNA glycosylase